MYPMGWQTRPDPSVFKTDPTCFKCFSLLIHLNKFGNFAESIRSTGKKNEKRNSNFHVKRYDIIQGVLQRIDWTQLDRQMKLRFFMN